MEIRIEMIDGLYAVTIVDQKGCMVESAKCGLTCNAMLAVVARLQRTYAQLGNNHV